MLRIRFNSPLLALIATCGIATGSAFAANPLPPNPASPPAPGGGHGGGGGGFGGGGHGPANPGGGAHDGFPGAGGVHGTPAGGGGGGFHPPAPAPAPYHPAPAPAPAPYHPAPAPAPAPYHPAPAPYHPAPAPAPMPGHDGFPGAGGVHGTPAGGDHGGNHPGPAPAPFPGGNHGDDHGNDHGNNHGPNPGDNHGPFPGNDHGGNHPGPAPFPGGNHGGGNTGGHDGFPGPGGVHGTPHGYPVGHTHGPGYSYGHDGHGDIVSPVYHDHIDLGRQRMDDMRRDSRVRVVVDRRAQDWRLHDHDELIRDNDRFAHYHDAYRDRYRPWWNEGFYGGCYWNFHPYYDIDSHFYNPVVYRFYGSDMDDYYYRTWYGSDYDRYPEFRTRYQYVGVFVPTEEFRDLNLGVSAMGIEVQARYFRASTILGERLDREVQNRGGRALGQKSVVINHYQILPADRGIVVEGFVDQGNIEFSFKAFEDLVNPENTRIFSVSADDEMSDDQLDELRDLNTQIEDQGGVIEGANIDDSGDSSDLGN